MRHWSLKYMKVGYLTGADGPEFFDCWNFVRWVWRDHYSIEMPLLPTPGDMTETMRAFTEGVNDLGWKEVQEPKDGDGVMFARIKHGVHVGIYVGDLNPPRVLHCDESGVALHTFAHLDLLRWKRRFYRYGV